MLQREDRRISQWQEAFKNIDRVTTVLPVPDEQQPTGLSSYWVFHHDQFRTISIMGDDRHEDRVVVEDQPVTNWKSLTQSR